MARRLSYKDKIKGNKMQTSPSFSTPLSLDKIPADASIDDESQASQLRKAAKVLANISVS